MFWEIKLVMQGAGGFSVQTLKADTKAEIKKLFPSQISSIQRYGKTYYIQPLGRK